MIRVSSLYSLENIQDYYFIDNNLNVMNIETGHVKKATKSKRDGYLYYTLIDKDHGSKKVYAHKIVALAFIRNEEYILINHIDGDKANNSVENLEFANKSQNSKHAYELGLVVKPTETYKLVLKNGEVHIGTIKELNKVTGISSGTLYDNVYQNRESRKIKNIEIYA